jgi:pimeloyl-ACP methyl ester carboxylesterase
MRYAILLFATLLPTVAGLAQQPAPTGNPFVGTWQGPLEVSGMRLRLAFTISRDSAGALRGSLVSIDQGNQAIPATFTIRGDSLIAAIPAIGASYAGVLNAARDSLRGSFTQGMTVPLNLARVGAITALVRPQEPRPPYPYKTEDVAFESVSGVRLAGTVTIPAGPGPFPAVVMVSGSGPQDRDETLMGHKPFLVLADFLARRGIASLRYDDRGVGKSTGSFGQGTSEDFANDAESAVRFLRGHSAVAPSRVGIVGHSEGGMIGPMVAARTGDVAFLVLLAGPGISGDSILVLQSKALLAANGADSARVQLGATFNRRVYDVLKSGVDTATMRQRLRTLFTEFFASLPASERANASPAAVDQQLSQILSPWFLYFIKFDPAPNLRRVRVPVLAVNGTRDIQVPYQPNLAGIAAALREAGNRDYRVVELPMLNHLFQTATTGNVSEYGTIEETISPQALELVASWILERFGRR